MNRLIILLLPTFSSSPFFWLSFPYHPNQLLCLLHPAWLPISEVMVRQAPAFNIRLHNLPEHLLTSVSHSKSSFAQNACKAFCSESCSGAAAGVGTLRCSVGGRQGSTLQKGLDSCFEAKSVCMEECTFQKHSGCPYLEDIHIGIITSLVLPTHNFSWLWQISVSFSRPEHGRTNPRKYENFFSTFKIMHIPGWNFTWFLFLNNLNVFPGKHSHALCL